MVHPALAAPACLNRLTGVDVFSSSSLGVRAALCFFDDGDAPNAFAIPRRMFPDGPDGTVLLGINLVELEWRRNDQQGVDRKVLDQSLRIILAHEYAHILQYKNGMTPNGPWQMEPHADFMAGWCLGNYTPLDIELAVKSMFERGDRAFYDRTHHGEPELRAAMVLAGYDASKLNLQAAFEKGRKMASLG
jgi:hypothetical protein